MTLYPIGTILTTWRPSQFHLFMELFPKHPFEYTRYPLEGPEESWESSRDNPGECKACSMGWRIAVTHENQAYLSPVPMVGDLVDADKRYSVPTTIYVSEYDVGLLGNPSAVVKRIIERTYHNGQRAPLIEWEKVILPNGE